jgi:hypothetical protein
MWRGTDGREQMPTGEGQGQVARGDMRNRQVEGLLTY